MTDQDRYEALLNIQVVLGIALGYVGPDATLSQPLSPEQMSDMLQKAKRDADALALEAGLGVSVPRPTGTKITAPSASPLLVLDKAQP